jgi:histidinol dehydrogenase
MDPRQIENAVAEVIAAVRQRGDEALLEFTRRWDGATLTPETLRVPEAAIDAADDSTPFAKALARAAARIRRFHEAVKPRSTSVEDEEGAFLGIRWTPIRAVGLYIPGGKAAYPSTLAMTAIPAQIAGVERIACVSPPGPDGEVSPAVLMAAKVLGIRELYRAGGAQAIAALALGTASIPRVDKVFGPGNAFVAEAKKQLYGEVGIDLLAGPSEVVVYADHGADPAWCAADLMAQAEHDEDTRVTLLASAPEVLDAVRREIDARLASEPRREVIEQAIARHGRFLVVETPAAAAAAIDAIAPEHLSLQVEDPEAVLPLVRNAGAIFLGRHSPVAVGDYYAGPNHVLPTGGTARFASCLSVEDFMKRSNVCRTTAAFIEKHGGDVEALASGERLPAHARSIALRRARGPIGPRPGFASVESYTLVDEHGEVKLNQNESPWDIPDAVKDEILAAMRAEPWNRYHQRAAEALRREMAPAIGIAPEGLFIGNGSNLILQWVFEAFVGPGRRLLVPSPSFSLYRMWGLIGDAAVETYRLEKRGGAFEYPSAEMARRIESSRPAMTVLCLPNNPSGTELARAGVEEVVAAAERAGGWVLIDEAYREFSGPAFDRTPLVRDGRRVFLVRTFSKALAAAGLRIGYLLAPPAARDAISKIIPPFHVGLFNAVAARVLWRHRGLFEERIQKLIAERARVTAALARFRQLEVHPSAGNFFMVRLDGAEKLHAALAARGVLVRKLWKDPLLADCLRINIGTPEENDRLLAEIERHLKGGS